MDGRPSATVDSSVSQSSDDLQVTVLLPTYNEELAIEFVLDDVLQTLGDQRITFEILVVDDASTDSTAAIVERYARACWQCPIRLVRCPERRGAGAARKVGIREAHGQIVVMLDADGTYPAEAIPELLAHFPAYDQVNGARTSEQGSWPLLRRPVKGLIRRLASVLVGRSIPDLNTGLKAFKRQAMVPWLWVVPDGFSCVTTMTLAFLTNGYRVKYVPTHYRRRIGLSKFHPIRDTWSYLITVLRLVLYFRPLRLFFPLAGALTFLGAAFWWASGVVLAPLGIGHLVVVLGGLTAVMGLLAECVAANQRH